MAGQLGEDELAEVMQSALDEGYEWDRAMTDLAEQVNPMAAEGEEDDEDAVEDEDEGDTEQSAAEGGQRGRGQGSRQGGASQAQGSSQKQGSTRKQGSAQQQGASQKQGGSQKAGGGGQDLRAREYKDEQGQVHHHTHEYMQRNKGR
jgi:hypothetical protein